MMKSDPHEPGIRLDDFAKNNQQEDFLLALNQQLSRVDLPQPPIKNNISKLPLIYVVGAPRSGTTLLSQLISRHLPVGYINNLIARFWLRPSVGIRLSRGLFPANARSGLSLRSQHGTTSGIIEPHEFGYFWRHWLNLDQAPTHHLTSEMLAVLDANGLKNALENEILASFACPVVFKNVICGFHADFLTQLHPASLFIHISREPFASAASILKVRLERFGSYRTWWSLKPSTFPFSIQTDDPAIEVATQVLECRREINEELAKPGIRSFQLSYEDLCDSPHRMIMEISARIKHFGYTLEPVDLEFMDILPAQNSILPPDLEARLHEYLEKRGFDNEIDKSEI